MGNASGRIFNIQRYCLHDGPGIRTTVFLKGCPLRCAWCHNPESLDVCSTLSFDASRCISCGQCERVCPEYAHQLTLGGHLFDRARCPGKSCTLCREACPSGALEILGRKAGVNEVLDKVIRDRPFYAASGGGMTLSGGEPALQADFSLKLLGAAKAVGLHTVVDTSGYGDVGVFRAMVSRTDLFLFDIKAEPAAHEAYTGVPFEPIRRNLAALCQCGANIRIRLPLVPGYNATEEHFAGIAEIMKEWPMIQGVDILPFHRLGRGKYGRTGQQEKVLSSVSVPNRETVEDWVARLKERGVMVGMVSG